jgi:hypothetical protein
LLFSYELKQPVVHKPETEAVYYRKGGHLIEIRLSLTPPHSYQVFFDGVKADEFASEEKAFQAVHNTFSWPKGFPAPKSKEEWVRGFPDSGH